MFNYNYFFMFLSIESIVCYLNLLQISQTYFTTCFNYYNPYYSLIHFIYLILNKLCFSLMFYITTNSLILFHLFICYPLSLIYYIFLRDLKIMTKYFYFYHFVSYFQWIGSMLHCANIFGCLLFLFNYSNHLGFFYFSMNKRIHDFKIDFFI